MARVQKDTVSYFPHDANASNSDTLTVLQSHYGNDGYAFWFKLLEKLASTEGHFLDCRDSLKWQIFVAKMGVSEITTVEIIKLLVEMQALDKELWNSRIIWCDNLVKNVRDVYINRKRQIPSKPILDHNKAITTHYNPITKSSSTQSKVKESKVKESKVEKEKTAEIFTMFEDNFQTITENTRVVLSDYIDTYGIDNVKEALVIAIKRNKRRLDYVEGILKGSGDGKYKGNTGKGNQITTREEVIKSLSPRHQKENTL